MYGFRRLYLDCKIVFELYGYSIWHGGVGLSQLYLDYVDCIWMVLIVFGLCWLYLDCVDCIWIARLYLDYTIRNWLYLDCVDCTIVFGLYDCIWIVQLYLDCTIVFGLYNCGIWHRGYSITYTPPLCQKFVPKRIWSIIFGLCRLHLDCVDYMWIGLIVCASILGQRPIPRPPHPA